MQKKASKKFQPKGLWLIQDTWQTTPHLAKNMPRLAQNAKLNKALSELMSDTLKTGWSAYLDEQILTLKVPHNAIATRIKQIIPLLVDGLVMIGWSIDKMEVKVSHFNHPAWLGHKKKSTSIFTARILSSTSSQHIKSAMTHLPKDSPLRDALARILTTHQT